MTQLCGEACPRNEPFGFLKVPGSPPASLSPGRASVSSPWLTLQTKSFETIKQQVISLWVKKGHQAKVLGELKRQMDGDVRGCAGNTAPCGNVIQEDARGLSEFSTFLSWGILEE